MPAEPIHYGGLAVGLRERTAFSNTVTGSPATNAETVVCTLAANNNNITIESGVFLNFCISYTVGTSGTAVTYRIRQGTVAGSGTVIYTSGATTAGIAAANLVIESLNGFDASPTMPGQAYCCTVTVTGGAAASTVSAATGFALFI